MTHWLEEVERLIRAETSDLRSLARLAGGDPRTFYAGTSMKGADLRGQNLSGMTLDFESLRDAVVDETTILDEQVAAEEVEEDQTPSSFDLFKGGAMAAVDLGASKVSCFIMKPDGVRRGNRSLLPAGIGYSQTRDMHEGVAFHDKVAIEALAQAAAQAVERAETVAGISVRGVTVATSGGRLSSRRIRAEVSLGASPISEKDCNRAIAAAAPQTHESGRRLIHLLPIAWSVDEQGGLRDPRSMVGQVLGLELLAVSIDDTAFNLIRACIEGAHLTMDGVVAAPFVSALAVLDDAEMGKGAICIDMGGGSTSLAVFSAGSLRHVDSIAMGGLHVTADIARSLSIWITDAERIKILHGSAIASTGEDREMIKVPPRTDNLGAGSVMAPRSLLRGIIAPRVEETLELVRERLKGAGLAIEPGAGVILAGGASQLTGVRELAARIFDRPVRLGQPSRMPHLADAASGPAFSAAAGVLYRAAFGPREAIGSRKLTAWLRDNL